MNNLGLSLICPKQIRELRSETYQYTISVIDLNTQKVLHTRCDYSGYHTNAAFTEDENIVIYLSFDKHWYMPPSISLWDLKEDTVQTIFTEHDSQSVYLSIDYHPTMRLLALGGVDGSMSTYNIETHEIIWTREATVSTWKKILTLSISQCGRKVAALQEDNLSIYDFTNGAKLLSTPLNEVYDCCQFQENDQVVNITHPDKKSVKISCHNIVC